MSLQPIHDVMLNAAQDACANASFYLIKQEEVAEKKYPSIFHGWKQRLRNAIVTEEDVEYFDYDDEDGQWGVGKLVGARYRRFCGWKELLNPEIEVKRDVIVGGPVKARMEVGYSQITFHFDDEWRVTEDGTYIGIRMLDGYGETLADIPFDFPRCVLAGGSLLLTEASMSLTSLT